MKLYLLLLFSLVVTSRVKGQNEDYYAKPKKYRFIVTAGMNSQQFRTYENSIMTNAKSSFDPSLFNYQIGFTYSHPFTKIKGLTFNPEITVRQNRAMLHYTALWGIPNSQIGDVHEFNVRGLSTQFLLPVKYSFRAIGLSAGVFTEIPLSVKYQDQVWLSNQLYKPDGLYTVDQGSYKAVGQGWQAALELDSHFFQIKLFTSRRSRILSSSLLPGSWAHGVTLGWRF